MRRHFNPSDRELKLSSTIRRGGLPMTYKKFAAALLFAAFSLPALSQETLVVYWTKGFYPQEDKALDDMVDKFQKKTGVKVELSRYSPQESVPKAVAALDSGTPPDVAYGDVLEFQVAGKCAAEGRLEDRREGRACAVLASRVGAEGGGGARLGHAARRGVRRRVRLPGRRQVGRRGAPRGPLGHPRADEGEFPAGDARDGLPAEREDEEARLLRLPDEAPDHAHPVLEGHARGSGLQGDRHPEDLERLLGLLVRQGAGGLPQEDRQAHLLGRLADGRRLLRLVLLVPHVHGRVQRQG